MEDIAADKMVNEYVGEVVLEAATSSEWTTTTSLMPPGIEIWDSLPTAAVM